MDGMIIDPFQFASASQLWTPANMSTNLWYDAADSSTITLVSGAVSQWNDKSGFNRHISQPSVPTGRPLVTTAALNGLNVITFDGVNDYLDNSSVGAAGFISVSIIAVFRMNSGGTSEDMIMGTGSTGSTRRCRAMYRAASGTTIGFSAFSGDVTSSDYSLNINGSYHIFEIANTQAAGPNQVQIGRNGFITSYTPSPNLELQSTSDGFTVGSLRGSLVGTYYSAVSVAEIVVKYGLFLSSERLLLQGYLGWKWGLQGNLPLNHLYKNSAPTV